MRIYLISILTLVSLNLIGQIGIEEKVLAALDDISGRPDIVKTNLAKSFIEANYNKTVKAFDLKLQSYEHSFGSTKSLLKHSSSVNITVDDYKSNLDALKTVYGDFDIDFEKIMNGDFEDPEGITCYFLPHDGKFSYQILINDPKTIEELKIGNYYTIYFMITEISVGGINKIFGIQHKPLERCTNGHIVTKSMSICPVCGDQRR